MPAPGLRRRRRGPPYHWSVGSGGLPPTSPYHGSDNNSQLSGTPTTAGTFTFTMRVSDYDGQQANQQFSLTVDPPLQISTTPLATGTVGVPYSRDLPAQGGAPPVHLVRRHQHQ